MSIGATPILLSKHTKPSELHRLNQVYGTQWAIADTAEAETGIAPRPIYRDTDNQWVLYRFPEPRIGPFKHPASKRYYLQPTSGSTGETKLCVRSEAAAFAEPLNHLNTLGIGERATVICPVPLYHAYGFGTGLLLALIASADLIVFDEFHPRKRCRTGFLSSIRSREPRRGKSYRISCR